MIYFVSLFKITNKIHGHCVQKMMLKENNGLLLLEKLRVWLRRKQTKNYNQHKLQLLRKKRFKKNQYFYFQCLVHFVMKIGIILQMVIIGNVFVKMVKAKVL